MDKQQSGPQVDASIGGSDRRSSRDDESRVIVDAVSSKFSATATATGTATSGETGDDDKVSRSDDHIASAIQEEPECTYIECLRQRNAVYSKRKYYKNKLFLEELQTKTEKLTSTNCELRIENQQLQDMLQKAQQEIIARMSRSDDAEKLLPQQQPPGHQHPPGHRAAVALSHETSENDMLRDSIFQQRRQQQQQQLRAAMSIPQQPRDIDSVTSDFEYLQALRRRRQEEELSLLFLQQEQQLPTSSTTTTNDMYFNPYLMDNSSNIDSSSFLDYHPAATTIPPSSFRLGQSTRFGFDLNVGNTNDIPSSFTSNPFYNSILPDDSAPIEQAVTQTDIHHINESGATIEEQQNNRTSPLNSVKQQQLPSCSKDIDVSSLLQQYGWYKLLAALWGGSVTHHFHRQQQQQL